MTKLTRDQAVIISSYTGILCCLFSEMHKEVEKRLGESVWTHQFGDKKFWDDRIKPAFKEDFLAMCNNEETQ